MTFLPAYYRRSYYKPKNNTPLMGGVVSKSEMAGKMEKKLNIIYKSSPMLDALQFKETESLYDILSRNGIKLDSLVQTKQLREKEEENIDVKMVDVEDVQNDESTLNINPRGQLNQKINISELKMKNRKLMISLLNLPVEIIRYESLIENFIEFCIRNIIDYIPKCTLIESNEDIYINPGFQWYSINVNELVTQDVFIVFEDAIMMYLFIQLVNDRIEIEGHQALKITNDNDINDKIIPKIKELFFLEENKLNDLRPLVVSHINELIDISIKTYKVEKSEEQDDYLTSIKKISENYTVSSEDLSDVPAYMIDSVKEYIIDFRIHVLKDLEKKQKQRELGEQVTSSNNNNNNNNNNKNNNNNNYNNEIKINNGKDAIKIDENMRNMTDIEFERMLINKEKSLLEKNYYIKLNKYKRSEEIRLKKYYNYLNFVKHESYLKNVIPLERKKFLSNFVDNVVDEKNKIDINFDYYVKHSNYEKYRLNAKKNEEINDALIDSEENEDNLQQNKNETSKDKESMKHSEQTNSKE